jgi:hypothetical protein
MKTTLYKLLLLSIIIVVSSCKKSEEVPLNKPDDNALLATPAADGHLPLTVITIAGKYNTSGYADGIGDQARFTGVASIDLADDGSLYVADTYNHKVRKITMPNIVSTVNIPKSKLGESLYQPNVVRVQKDGTINIIAAVFDYLNLRSKFWIIKPGSTTSLTPPRHSNSYTYNYSYYELSKDPYNSFLFLGGMLDTYPNGSNYQEGIIEKFLPDSANTYGKDLYKLPTYVNDTQVPNVTSIFCGYNAVKYIIVNWHSIYKLTPSGVFKQLYPDHRFYSISDIVATKDSQTLYIAEDGAIKTITDGKIRYLVGPHKELKGRDGVGAKADVYAYALALSKDEGTLYFTDGHTTVRKILLR